jgi:hypothetical protein
MIPNSDGVSSDRNCVVLDVDKYRTCPSSSDARSGILVGYVICALPDVQMLLGLTFSLV